MHRYAYQKLVNPKWKRGIWLLTWNSLKNSMHTSNYDQRQGSQKKKRYIHTPITGRSCDTRNNSENASALYGIWSIGDRVPFEICRSVINARTSSKLAKPWQRTGSATVQTSPSLLPASLVQEVSRVSPIGQSAHKTPTNDCNNRSTDLEHIFRGTNGT